MHIQIHISLKQYIHYIPCTACIEYLTSSISNCPPYPRVTAAPGSGECPNRLVTESVDNTVTLYKELTTMND